MGENGEPVERGSLFRVVGKPDKNREHRVPALCKQVQRMATRHMVYQRPRKPTERERGILTLIAERPYAQAGAGHLDLAHRSVTSKTRTAAINDSRA